jgi:hypothetical protein
MARAVATLEGDSSSLVSAIDKAKGSMQKLEVEGKKLTDQLRDVADEADKAAGALVNKIGGPGAIKAMAGVGAAFAGASVALGALSSSMSAFYSTQGEAGAKAMADIDMAMNKMSSQLFTAVMGTDNLEEATQTLLTVINFLSDALNVILWPLEQAAKFLRMMSELGDQGATAAEKHAKELTKFVGVQDTVKVSYDNVAEAIAKNKLNVMGLTGATDDLAKAQIRQQMAIVNSLADSAKAAETTREEAEIGLEVLNKKAENMARATETAVGAKLVPGSEEFVATVNSVYAGLTLATLNSARAAREGWSKETKQLLADAGADYQALQLLLFAVGQTAAKTSTQVNSVRTGGAPAGPAAPELTDQQEMEAFYAESAAKQAAASAKAMADGIAAVVAAERAKAQAKADAQAEQLATFGGASDAEVAAYKSAQAEKAAADQAEFEAARQRAIELHDLTFNFQQTAADFAAGERAKEKAAHDEKVNQLTAGFQEYGKLAGQQLAEGEKASKVAEKLAKKALGAQISALGDKAMVEAAIFAAAFNPMAIPMAAAGVAAYAAAAALGAEGKKATTATPASAAPAAAPVNTAFNLRVDAAFADGESIARQFAMMQRSAQSRGLVPAGA